MRLTGPGVVFAAALITAAPVHSAEPKIDAAQAILMDAATGYVLYEKNADAMMHPASMSKLMTLAMVFKALKENKLTMQSEFTASVNAWRTGGAPSGTSAMFIPIKESVTLAELLPGITVQSGNDACIMIAEGMSGSEAAFAREMNERARALGLKKSNFVNSTGLSHPEHLMTARELAMLARHVINDYPEYYHYFSMREFSYRKHKFVNRNPLLGVLGVDGLKTGFTAAAGYGLVISGTQDNHRLIAVVNGLKKQNERAEEGKALLEYGFKSFKQYTLFKKDERVGDALVWGGTQRYVNLVGKDGVQVLLPKGGNNRNLKASIVYHGPLVPPIKKGDQVAVLRITTADSTTNQILLYAAEDVGVGSMWIKGFDSLLLLAFGWIL